MTTQYEVMSPDGPGDDSALRTWVIGKTERALNAADTELSQQRERMWDAYHGEKYGTEEDGRSAFVTREVFEAVEWAKPSLLRTFMGTGRPVEFLPMGAEDEEQAKQDTDVVGHVVMNLSNAFELFQTWFTDALVQPVGYAKVWWDDTPRYEVVRQEGLTRLQVALLLQDPHIEPLSGEARIEQTELGPIEVFDVRLRYATPQGELRIEPVPPEEVLIDNDANQLCLDDCEFVCHHRQLSRSELVKMGWDRDMVDALPVADRLEYSSERINRARYHDEDPHYDTDTGAMEKVDFYEAWALYDYDDDGIAEKRRIVFAGRGAGTQVFYTEPTEYQPMLSIATTPQPHRHAGISMAEAVEDIQRVNTELTRGGLNNLYRTNEPRTFVGPGVNPDQVRAHVPDGVVECQDISQVRQETIPVALQNVLAAVDSMRDSAGARTGVTRHTQGLDADVLARSTMGAFMGAVGESSQRLELIARGFAETGVIPMYRKVHHLLRTRQNVPLTVNLRGQWVDVDPRDWHHRSNMAPRVGLGTGSQQERIAQAQAMLEIQEKAYAEGFSTPDRVYRALEDWANAIGKRHAHLYFLDPESDEGQEQWARRAQQAEEQRQLAAQAQTAPLAAAGAIEGQKRQVDAAKLALDARKEQNRHWEQVAKLEADAAIDAPGGLVSPVPSLEVVRG